MKTLLSCLTLTLLATAAGADETKLTATLTIKDVQGGFAGFTGKQWTIEPSGKWTMSDVFNQKLTEKARGELSAEKLAELVKELERYGLGDLPAKKPARSMANPHVVTITLGKRDASLELNAGEALPKPDPDKPKGNVENRYAGIVAAVQKALREK
jgi:hypothetical protein